MSRSIPRPPAILLASSSPRRRRILREARIPFRCRVPDVSERLPRSLPPHRRVRVLAERKAAAAARGLREGLVLAADTLVSLRGRPIGKPRDLRHGRRILAQLSGTQHDVWTAVRVLDVASGRGRTIVVRSRVAMRALAPEEIDRLARKGQGKAGAYGIQDRSDPIVRLVRGSRSNVVGLPLRETRALLRAMMASAARRARAPGRR